MAQLIIHGGKPLSGKVQISGAKNAVLPLMAVTVLANDLFTINNVPNISDVHLMTSILEDLGSKITWTTPTTLTIDNSNLHYAELDFEKLRKIRASILVIGPLLARFGKARFIEPGGCKLGTRSIDTHIHAFEALGTKVDFDGERYNLTSDGLKGTRFVLNDVSVTGTANALMTAVLASGTTEIRMAAAEPENTNLIEALISMGATITGIGSHNLTVSGTTKLHGATFTVIPDRIEAITFAVATVATKGEIIIDGYYRDHLDVVTQTLENIGAKIEFLSDSEVRISSTNQLTAFDVRTNIYPAFPTDMQALFGALMTQCHGTSHIFETMYNARLGYLESIKQMGGQINILDPHRAEVTGPAKLVGSEVVCPDIRGGAGLLIAGLTAGGTTTLNNAELIDRGYTAIEVKLKALGADIQRV